MKNIIIGFLLGALLTTFTYSSGLFNQKTQNVSSGTTLTVDSWNNMVDDIKTLGILIEENKTYIDTKISEVNNNISIGSQLNPGLSCSDILSNSAGTVNGYYWIKPDSNPEFLVYCDMDSGGWTRIYLNTSTSINTSRYNDCNSQGHYKGSYLECVKPDFFTNIKFTRNGYSDIIMNSSYGSFQDTPGVLTGWQFSADSGSNWYTMRDYKHPSYGYNTGRWGTAHSTLQNQIVIWGK